MDNAQTPPESPQKPDRKRRRIPKSVTFSDLDLSRWKEYDDIITDSLWLLGRRDKTGPHVGDYWGNFVPQIAQQVLLRFTKKHEIVVDLFSGMGTTLIECRHLGRHGIGIELSAAVAQASEERINTAANSDAISTKVLVADSTANVLPLIHAELSELQSDWADCVIMHPPYHDIIKFSEAPNDLSNCTSLADFLAGFRRAAANAYSLLRPGRFMALVIGDKYTKSEWVPLGFECMQICRETGFQLKAVNVKDIQGNERGKGKSENLWKYRALREGFYIFKHEYVMIFRKPQ